MKTSKLNNEQQLFSQMIEGNELAFEQIFHHYNARLFPFLLKKTKSVQVAEELVQEFFIKLWKNRHLLIDVNDKEAYIYSMVSNMLLNHLRKTVRDRKLLEELWLRIKEAYDPGEDLFDFKESESIIKTAVGLLPPQRKKIYLMSRETGLSHAKISQILHISKSTVNNQLTQALIFIRTYINKKYGNSLGLGFILVQIMSDNLR